MTNTGNVPVTGIAVVDPMVGGVSCEGTTLAPEAFTDCEGVEEYVITEEDQDNGTVQNTATASGSDPDEDLVQSDPDSTNTPVRAQAPSLTIDKADALVDEDGDAMADVGEEVDYTFTVQNTGNVRLDDIEVNDPRAGSVTCVPADLPVEGTADCTADEPYVVTQADVDGGSVDNAATATGTPPAGADPVESPEDTTSTPTDSRQGLALEKGSELRDRDSDDHADAGEVVRYSFTVTNTGTTTVTDIAVDDPMLQDAGVSIDCSTTTLAPGESIVCTADYEVSDADVDDGKPLRNVASVLGDGVDGPVTSPDDATQTPVDQPASNGILPDTGGQALGLLALAFGLIGVGFALTRGRRKRSA